MINTISAIIVPFLLGEVVNEAALFVRAKAPVILVVSCVDV
jgi:hypothetical protein